MMKVERIALNKMKITLTDDDIISMDIDFDELSGDAEKANELFWTIIDEAENGADFFTDGSQLVVEASHNDNNDFVITVTKIDDYPSHYRYAKAKIKRKSKAGQYFFYAFDDISSTVNGCKRIRQQYCGESSLYKYGGKYYLQLAPNGRSDVHVLLCDYGEGLHEDADFSGVLAENGEVIIRERAVECLHDNF